MGKRAGNEIDAHVGARLRAQRLVLSMSQETLARALNVTFQQVQKYEKGSNRMGASRLFEVAQVLGVLPAYFFEDLGQECPLELPRARSHRSTRSMHDELLTFVASQEGAALNRAFRAVASPRLRRKIVQFVQALADHPDESGRGGGPAP